jgi:hypothetical protein
MHALGKGFGQRSASALQQDRGVIVIGRLKRSAMPSSPMPAVTTKAPI